MANRLYNQQISPKGYKRGGGVTGKTTTTKTTTTTKSEKKPGFFKRTIGKIRKKIVPTFGEQFADAKKKGKKTFRSTRDDKKKGKLEYATTTKKEADRAKAFNKRIDKKTGAKRVRKAGDKYESTTGTKLSSFGSAFSAAKKAGKKEFTYKGKKFTTLLKGEKPNKILPELSGKTSKKIKKFVGA